MPETSRNLTLFFDSTCPLCVGEMRQLRKLDTQNRLTFEDIYLNDFTERYPDIEPSKAANVFHGQYENGDMLYGLDVSVEAWGIVGKNKWMRLLRLPGVRIISDLAYRFFARYRSQISLLLTGKRYCESFDLK